MLKAEVANLDAFSESDRLLDSWRVKKQQKPTRQKPTNKSQQQQQQQQQQQSVQISYKSNKKPINKPVQICSNRKKMSLKPQALVVHGWACPTSTPAPPAGFESSWKRFLPEMMHSYKVPKSFVWVFLGLTRFFGKMSWF